MTKKRSANALINDLKIRISIRVIVKKLTVLEQIYDIFTWPFNGIKVWQTNRVLVYIRIQSDLINSPTKNDNGRSFLQKIKHT